MEEEANLFHRSAAGLALHYKGFLSRIFMYQQRGQAIIQFVGPLSVTQRCPTSRIPFHSCVSLYFHRSSDGDHSGINTLEEDLAENKETGVVNFPDGSKLYLVAGDAVREDLVLGLRPVLGGYFMPPPDPYATLLNSPQSSRLLTAASPGVFNEPAETVVPDWTADAVSPTDPYAPSFIGSVSSGSRGSKDVIPANYSSVYIWGTAAAWAEAGAAAPAHTSRRIPSVL